MALSLSLCLVASSTAFAGDGRLHVAVELDGDLDEGWGGDTTDDGLSLGFDYLWESSGSSGLGFGCQLIRTTSTLWSEETAHTFIAVHSSVRVHGSTPWYYLGRFGWAHESHADRGGLLLAAAVGYDVSSRCSFELAYTMIGRGDTSDPRGDSSPGYDFLALAVVLRP